MSTFTASRGLLSQISFECGLSFLLFNSALGGSSLGTGTECLSLELLQLSELSLPLPGEFSLAQSIGRRQLQFITRT
jgi:hypothetical protein